MIRKATTQADFFNLIRVRTNVFTIEQGIAADEDVDDIDLYCTHYIFEQDNKVIATARLLVQDGHYYLGRICVLKAYRKQAIGKKLLLFIENELKKEGINEVYLSAQINALGFYHALGYQAFGDVYLDCDIEHQSMKKKI